MQLGNYAIQPFWLSMLAAFFITSLVVPVLVPLVAVPFIFLFNRRTKAKHERNAESKRD